MSTRKARRCCRPINRLLDERARTVGSEANEVWYDFCTRGKGHTRGFGQAASTGRTIEVSDEDVSQFWDAIGVADRKRQILIAAYTQSMPKSAEEEALEADQQDIADGFERRFASAELRPEQAAFRRSLMRFYGSRRVGTGYERLTGRQVRHRAKPEFIRRHYEEFASRNRQGDT
ncbi:hypothetical protein NKI48_23370 [Mesorhizobium sp. M0644]|uniref:hypothetical protein n=1 Tax=unclassified Mesorhizobium TaxID=325217 RepID=UPI00333E1769